MSAVVVDRRYSYKNKRSGNRGGVQGFGRVINLFRGFQTLDLNIWVRVMTPAKETIRRRPTPNKWCVSQDGEFPIFSFNSCKYLGTVPVL